MKKISILFFCIASGCNEQKTYSSSRERFFAILSAVCDRVESDYVTSFSENEIYERMMGGILANFDSFSRYLPEGEFQKLNDHESLDGFGLELDLQERCALVLNVYENSPAKEAGIKPFDRILEINNERATHNNTRQMQNSSSVDLMIEREGFPLQNIKLVRRKIELKSTLCDIEKDIATIRILTFNMHTAKEMRAILHRLQKKNLRGLILDLRNNAGGLLDQGVEVCRFFIETGVIVTVKYRDGEDVYEAKGKDWMYGIPMIVLVNRYCASAAELVAGALKDYGRALVVGERTFGKGSVQSLIRLPGAGGIRLTCGYFYTPHGRPIHEKGIIPNIYSHHFKNVEQYFKKPS
jgi:carboxyl-terminal processing protease